METRHNVIRLYEIHRRDLANGSMTWEQLALMAGPSKKFCVDLAGKHDRSESIEALPSVPNPVVKFDEAGIEALFSIYEDNPSYILSEYKDILLMKFDIEASESTICHLLNHELDLTLKLVTIDRAEKYTEENELMAMQYWQDIGICEPSTVKCFDECAVVAKRHEAPLARAPRGQRVVWTIPNPEKYRLSVNGLTALNCWSPSVMWNWCNGTTSGIDFLEFMMTGIETGFVVPGDTIVADNYQGHKQYLEILQDMMDAAGVSLIFLPKYCPELNPIELVWSKMKYKIRRYGKHTEQAAKESIARALSEVTNGDIFGYYSKCGIVQQWW